MSRLALAGAVGAALLAAPPAGAQLVEVGDPLEEYGRLLQISGLARTGTFTVRPAAVVPDTARPGHPWHALLDRLAPPDTDGWSAGESRLRLFANTHYPYVTNDGVIWQGRGVTAAVDTRAALEWRALSISLNPTLIYHQNASFELAVGQFAEQPVWAYPWRKIDLPQRFGPDAFWTAHPGQSEIALRWRGARASFGTKNRWWGPGVRNAIIMSNNAAGFPHAALSTDRPLDIGIGRLEGQWIWGRLEQSDYFDPAYADTERFLTGIVLAYEPSFLPGLTLGGTRLFYQFVPDGGVPAREYLLVLQGLFKTGFIDADNPEGNDARDQLLSFFARWAFPRSGFEAYVEWSRNDHSLDLRDFLLEPEHSQGYTLGFQKVTSLSSERMVTLRGELTHLESPPTFQIRGRGIYYEHFLVRQGYTHRGQVVGAGLGPGGNAQALSVDFHYPWGRIGGFAERQVHDNDAFWVWAPANGLSFDRHNVSFDFGASALVFADDFELGGGLIVTRELNRYFYASDKWNVNVSLSAHWRPGWRSFTP